MLTGLKSRTNRATSGRLRVETNHQPKGKFPRIVCRTNLPDFSDGDFRRSDVFFLTEIVSLENRLFMLRNPVHSNKK